MEPGVSLPSVLLRFIPLGSLTVLVLIGWYAGRFDLELDVKSTTADDDLRDILDERRGKISV